MWKLIKEYFTTGISAHKSYLELSKVTRELQKEQQKINYNVLNNLLYQENWHNFKADQQTIEFQYKVKYLKEIEERTLEQEIELKMFEEMLNLKLAKSKL